MTATSRRLMYWHELACVLLLLLSLLVSPNGAVARNHAIRSLWSPDSTPVAETSMHRLNLALTHKPEGLKHLVELVGQVSDPQHPMYAQYKTNQQLASMLAPSNEDLVLLEKILLDAGAVEVDLVDSRDFMSVLLPISAVHKLFSAPSGEPLDLRVHTHRHSGRKLLRTLHGAEFVAREPHLTNMLQVVIGLTDFVDYPKERKAAKKAAKAAHRKHTMATAARKIKSGRKLTESEEACVSSAPDFGFLVNSHEDVSVSVVLYCTGGKSTTDPVNPCSDFPPAIQNVMVLMTPHAHEVRQLTYSIKDLKCALEDGQVVCTLPTIEFPAYAVMQLQTSAQFTDGSISPLSSYGQGFASSPYVLPDTIFERYSVPLATKGSMPGNSQAVVSFCEEYISIDGDYKNFSAALGMAFNRPIVVGVNDESKPQGEATLDIQWITAVGQNIPSYFLSTSGSGPAKPPGDGAFILDWALWVANQTSPPLVTSISHGDTEQAFFDKFGSNVYMDRTDVELAKMAVRGLTVIAGSGDAGTSNVGATGNVGPFDLTCLPMRAFYPSSSPYITSVSATFLTTAYIPACQQSLNLDLTNLPVLCEKVGEAAVSVREGMGWTTGGGFSNRSENTQQPWQQSVVNQYLNTAPHLPPVEGVWNPAGRAYPDVSTIGHNLLMNFAGSMMTVDGTSASGPIMAGLVALINDFRLREGLPPMGFLNPFLYQSAALMNGAFMDVVVGQNNDGQIEGRCSGIPSTCPDGFSTQQGWNPVTGLGTPNWSVLKDLAINAATKPR